MDAKDLRVGDRVIAFRRAQGSVSRGMVAEFEVCANGVLTTLEQRPWGRLPDSSDGDEIGEYVIIDVIRPAPAVAFYLNDEDVMHATVEGCYSAPATCTNRYASRSGSAEFKTLACVHYPVGALPVIDVEAILDEAVRRRADLLNLPEGDE